MFFSHKILNKMFSVENKVQFEAKKVAGGFAGSGVIRSACHVHTGPQFESQLEDLCCTSHPPLSLSHVLSIYCQIKVSVPGKKFFKKKKEVANINKVKQYEIVLSLKVRLFIQFIQAWKQREFVYLVCLGLKKKKKTVNEDISLLTKISSLKLNSAPLILFPPVLFLLWWVKCLPWKGCVDLFVPCWLMLLSPLHYIVRFDLLYMHSAFSISAVEEFRLTSFFFTFFLTFNSKLTNSVPWLDYIWPATNAALFRTSRHFAHARLKILLIWQMCPTLLPRISRLVFIIIISWTQAHRSLFLANAWKLLRMKTQTSDRNQADVNTAQSLLSWY